MLTFTRGIMIANYSASFINFDTFSKLKGNGHALHLYALITSAQKLTNEIKPNSTGFLRIQRHNRK